MPMVNLGEMGGRIRRQRTYLGYTRETMSEKLGVTPKFCSDIELGQKGVSLQTLCSLSNVLKVSTDYILFGREGETNTSSIQEMLRCCPPDKLPYAEGILKNFLTAIE